MMEQEVAKRGGIWREKGEQEGVDDGDNGEELEAVVPVAEARALNGEFGFEEAEAGFDLPATGIGKEHLPGIVDRSDGLIGEEMPSGALLGTGHH